MPIRLLILVIISFILTTCLERYNPNVGDYIDLPVIEGAITNEPGPYIIKLSKSLDTYDLGYSAISGATIIISDDLGENETLVELEPGIYSTQPNGIQGTIGRKYRISVSIGEKLYQSEFDELEEDFCIDTIYTKIESKEIQKGSIKGLQFYINFITQGRKNKHALIVPIETFKYNADLELKLIDYGDDIEIINDDSIRICWQTKRIFDVFTFSAENNTTTVKGFPLHFVSTETKKLSVKYSLLVNIYSLSDQAYRFWNEIKQQNNETGALYSKQPFLIKGNLKNINDQNDLFLGCFMVAGVSKKRIFVERPPLDFTYDICIPVELGGTIGAPPIYPIYITLVDGVQMGAPAACFYCESEGGSTTKPDFWED